MSKDEYIDSADVAELLGITPQALRVKRARTKSRLEAERLAGKPGKLTPSDVPDPDIDKGRSPLWLRSTIDRWVAVRPDPGRRNTQNR